MFGYLRPGVAEGSGDTHHNGTDIGHEKHHGTLAVLVLEAGDVTQVNQNHLPASQTAGHKDTQYKSKDRWRPLHLHATKMCQAREHLQGCA